VRILQAAAMTTSVAMAIIGVGIAGRMINRQQVLPVVPEIPAIPAAVQALPIIPAVQGNVSFVFCKSESWFLPGQQFCLQLASCT
jgi:hypothetical protein